MERDQQPMEGHPGSMPSKKKKGQSEEEKRDVDDTQSAATEQSPATVKKAQSKSQRKQAEAQKALKAAKQEAHNQHLAWAQRVPVNKEGKYDHGMARESALQ